MNETAGDGLMVIFQDADMRRHAVSAVLAGLGVLRRTTEINAAPERRAASPSRSTSGSIPGRPPSAPRASRAPAGTRWTNTASGPVTNVAARLAALGRATP